MELRRILLEILEDLAINGPKKEACGICYYVYQGLVPFNLPDKKRKEVEELLMHLTATWEHYSGSPAYPVPHPDFRDCGCEAYHTKLLWRGEYGWLRRQLLKHIIKHLKKT